MKVLATIIKEFLLLIRDPGGLALIFLMPLALVVVMAMIQDNTFRALQDTRIDVLFIDEDGDALGAGMARSLESSPHIRIIRKQQGQPVTKETAEHSVQRGSYQAAVLIPPQATASLRKKMKGAAEGLLAGYGMAPGATVKKESSKDAPAVALQILFDPAAKAGARQIVAGAVERSLSGLQGEWFADAVQNLMGGAAGGHKTNFDFSAMIRVDQTIASGDAPAGMALNAVQHNIPAWSMFAMFFILFPLAGNFIKEREEGSMLRLRLISGSQFPVIAGKFYFYLFVCLLQLALMIAVGLYLMPLVGLSKLVMGTNRVGLALTGLAVAMAATGYGLLIAVYFRTPQQALSFGSISVVILAALGGVWVPAFMMPPVMQQISPYSPLSWGLGAFNDLFLRNAPTSAILPDIFRLTGFALATLAASVMIHRSRTIS